ncbi:alpha/beta hydrolase [Bradyrhizobium prioriisuperbiae]|uniref:alpha/beta hydrolase n=1 Tax=Bradyrhizobium prioriisuperbiae TaxID=2854389 RepID=UPI0028E6E910|nr:alpha/beta hydrolase [Bradyrhizobium prioritasuperba]
MTHPTPNLEALLPSGIRSRLIPDINGLTMHVLEAGFESEGRPVIVLLHGFPELAFSWRRVMPALAAAGFHVIAPDQRGYGRTTGSDNRYDVELRPFGALNLVRDVLGLLAALGIKSVATVVGHDFGSMVAAYCALLRPDVFRSVVLMSAPFGGPPALPFDTLRQGPAAPAPDISAALGALDPPRKHYQVYYSGREADGDMHGAPQGVHDFLRAYYYFKSADWRGNTPYRLESWTAGELAKLPTYYVMNAGEGMAETVAHHMPSREEIAACRWLPDTELAVYSAEYQRTGFQGGLNWYRCRYVPELNNELQIFSGRTIDVPSCFIAGASDWGIHQRPHDFERMQTTACTAMQACHLINGAGHWVQQEQSQAVAKLLTEFAAANSGKS